MPISTNAAALQARTKQFAVRVVKLSDALPAKTASRIIANQLLRSATGVAANYRAVCRARSKAEFISKIGIVVEEADEAVFWLELLVESGLAPPARMRALLSEANELLLIFAASRLTAKRNQGGTIQSSIVNQQIVN